MPARPGTTQSLVYDQVADHVVWPTPETAAKVEDVDILKDKHTGWDRATPSPPPPSPHHSFIVSCELWLGLKYQDPCRR